MYIILKQRESPLYITFPSVHGYVETIKEAKELVKKLNEKATTNEYWYVSAKKLI